MNSEKEHELPLKILSQLRIFITVQIEKFKKIQRTTQTASNSFRYGMKVLCILINFKEILEIFFDDPKISENLNQFNLVDNFYFSFKIIP